MITRSTYGYPLAGATFHPTLAALKAVNVTEHVPYEEFVLSDGRRVYYHPTCALTADEIFVFAPSNITVKGVSTAQAGAYLLSTGVNRIDVSFDYTTADAAALATLPTGCYWLNQRGVWEVTTSFTGGSSSAIGLSSDDASCNTKGDLLGGSGGDVAATLVSTGATYKVGTIGAKSVAAVAPGKVIRFDRVTSVFTAGVGKAHLYGIVIANPGA